MWTISCGPWCSYLMDIIENNNSNNLNNNSVCNFIKAKVAHKTKTLKLSNLEETALNRCLSFIDNFQKEVELNVINEFLKEFISNQSIATSITSKMNTFETCIPVYIFNPSKMISPSTCYVSLIKDSLNYSNLPSGSSKKTWKKIQITVIIDCAEIESKTEFFSQIFEGIIKEFETSGIIANTSITSFSSTIISYDFSAFQDYFNELTKLSKCFDPEIDFIIFFNNSSQLNLAHLNDFVRLWERKSSDFIASPKLKFIFDDPVSFLGMDMRLRDHFKIININMPKLQDVFDELVVEMIKDKVSIWIDPLLMARFVDLTISDSLTIYSLLKQLKFLVIGHFTKILNGEDIEKPKKANYNINSNTRDIFLFIHELSTNLKSLRPSTPVLSPSKDFYLPIFHGNVADSVAFSEISNELKSIHPNDFSFLFLKVLKSFQFNDDKNSLNLSKVSNIIPSQAQSHTCTHVHSKSKMISPFSQFIETEIIEVMKKATDSNKTKTSSSFSPYENVLKDVQLDLIKIISDRLRYLSLSTDHDISAHVISDPRGNVRRAFEADPLAALQIALKNPSIYLNCNNDVNNSNCLCTKSDNGSSDNFTSNSSNLPNFNLHNRQSMLDICLLYRISLEFSSSKTLNLINWYNSFIAVLGISSKRQYQFQAPLLTARFFKGLNELQLIGMVSEFGRSRRKRRSVERFNISDTLES